MFGTKELRQFFEKKAMRIDKRLRLVISVLSLGLLMLFSTFYNFDKALFFIPVFIISSYFLSYFSFLEGIKKISWFKLPRVSSRVFNQKDFKHVKTIYGRFQ